MRTFLTIKNYRCFVNPVKIELTNGLTSFVGVNNAGKSTIMRFLLEFRPLFNVIGLNSGTLRSFSVDGQEIFNPHYVLDNEEVFSNLNKEGIVFIVEFQHEIADSSKLLSKVEFQISRTGKWHASLFIGSRLFTSQVTNLNFRENFLSIAGIDEVDLRPLFNTVEVLRNTLYIGAFRNIINIGTNESYFDIQIGEAFIRQFKNFKSGNIKSQNESMTQLTSDIARIFEFDHLEINPSYNDKTLHINVNGKPYKQHELGSGLQQFILVMANVLIKKPTYILIDEPELNLHPKLQLDFLTTLSSYASHGIWFSSHSIGLARSASQQIYSVRRISDGNSEVKQFEDQPRLSEFLGEMSFSSYKDLGFDKILLVEGPTDVTVFQQFLRRLKKDHEVVLLPLSGRVNGNMADQLEEIKRISTNIYVIVDSEKKSKTELLSTDRKEFQDLCNKMRIKNHVLSYRAIENYFSDELVKNVFGQNSHGLSQFGHPKVELVDKFWGKNNNYKLAKNMSEDDFRQTDFYQFLAEL